MSSSIRELRRLIVDLVTIVDYSSAAEPLQLRLDLLQCQCLEAKADAFQHPNACVTFIGVELAGFHPPIKPRHFGNDAGSTPGLT